MAFTPPTTFADGTVLTSANLEGNFEALRVYLHGGIVAGDVEAAQWIDTRHVQPPLFEPFSGLQHGVSGHQGGQWGGGVGVRLSFATKFLTGGGRTSNNVFVPLPNTAFTIDCRQAAKVLFHYWYELEAGFDGSTGGQQVTAADRLVWIAPYVGPVGSAYASYRSHAQEAQNYQDGFRSTYPLGMNRTYPMAGGYGQRDGTLVYEAPNGQSTFGLAFHSQIDRVAVVNWGVALEAYYL